MVNVGRPKETGHKYHPTYRYIEIIKILISKEFEYTLDNNEFSNIVGTKEFYLFSKIPSKIRKDTKTYLSYETLLNWEFKIQNNCNIGLNIFKKFYRITQKYIELAIKNVKHPINTIREIFMKFFLLISENPFLLEEKN